jgi:membrane protein YfhO
MALLLYLATTLILIAAWHRWVQRVPISAVLALILLPLLFTGRAILTGRTYAPVDLPFMAEPLRDYSRDFGVATPYDTALSDLHCQILPWQKAVRYSLAHGEWPLWNPFILCGDILAAAAQPAVYDPLQLLGLLLPLADAFTFGATMTFFLAAFFTWAFARELGRGEIAALVAAAGFTFCGMMAFFVGWPLGRAWAFLPLVLLGARLVIRGRSPVVLTIALVLTIFAGHPESVLHIVAVGVVYGVFELIRTPGRRKRAQNSPRAILSSALKRTLISVPLAGVLALLLTAVYLLPFLEAVPQTLEHEIRDQLYASTSYDVLAKPDVRAGRIARTFIPNSGGHPWKKTSSTGWDPLSARVGPPILLLALIGMVLNVRKAETWFFTFLALIGLGATFGAWPIAHALHALPLFNIAINERLAFAAAFALSMLAALGIDALATARNGRNYAIAILAFVLVQRSVEDGGIYPALPREAFYPRVPILSAIPRDARMSGLWFAFTPNDGALYELEDARGYQAMTNKRLTETYPLWSKYQTAWFNRIDDLSRPFLSFLNVRYAIASTDPPPGWVIRAEDRGTRLLENTRVLPRAFVPRRVRYEQDGKTTIEAMQLATDFADLAWIEAAELKPHETTNGPGELTLRRSGLGYDIDARMEQDGWVVVSATAWKGWRAYVDGRRVQAHFANHAFLGVYVPRGSHRVGLSYLPESFTRGRNISLGTLGFLAVAAVCYRARRSWLRSSSTSSPAAP